VARGWAAVTLSDDEAAVREANARQAAYFRAELDTERRRLVEGIIERRTLPP